MACTLSKDSSVRQTTLFRGKAVAARTLPVVLEISISWCSPRVRIDLDSREGMRIVGFVAYMLYRM